MTKRLISKYESSLVSTRHNNPYNNIPFKLARATPQDKMFFVRLTQHAAILKRNNFLRPLTS